MAEVEVQGITLHVQRLGAGDGQPVLFLHGLMLDNLSSWYFTMANAVATLRPVILYDLRGHGRSARPATGYRLDDFVAELLGLLDALDIQEPVTLVGNSFGGLLALVFALEHPTRCGGLVLVDGLLPEPGWGDAMARTLGLQGEELDRLVKAYFPYWINRHSKRKRTRLAEHASVLAGQTTLLTDIRTSRSYDDAAFATLRCPVLALYGAESDVRTHGERLAACLPDVQLEILPGCSHSVLYQAPEQLRDHILAWLETH